MMNQLFGDSFLGEIRVAAANIIDFRHDLFEKVCPDMMKIHLTSSDNICPNIIRFRKGKSGLVQQ